MKINNKSKVSNISSDMQHSFAVLMCGYFSRNNNENYHHSGLLGRFSEEGLWRIGWQMDLLFFECA